jgi:hypothetical protein
MSVEIGLRGPVLEKDEDPRLVRGGVKIVIDAALLGAGRAADLKQSLAERALFAGLGAMVGDNGDFSRHL